MAQKTQTAKALTALIALALFVTGCTKKRDATLSEEASETIFSISEIETANTQYQIKTDDAMNTLTLGQASKATAEKGLVAVSEANVPARLKYMFKGLEMTAQSGRSYPIMLSVDKQFVTAYKVVTDLSELSLLEAQLAQVQQEVTLQKQLQKEKQNTKVKSLMTSLQKVRSEKKALFSQKDTQVLVPVFKFPVKGYGTLNRVKNELREETSNLRLKSTDWSEATHIQMSNNPSDRVLVGLDPASRGDLDRTFVMNKINNKMMTAGMLNDNYQIPVNLEKDVRVLTLLDVDALHVFEVGQVGKTVLTDSQLEQLRTGSKKSNVRACSADIVNALPADAQKDCVMILRYDVPVTYVRAELPIVDYDGNQNATIQFKPVRAADAVGLVQIAENVEAKKVEANTDLDPRTTIKVADIKNKEFFFKRTLEEGSFSIASPGIAAGMAGSLTIVKFDLEEKRLVVRKADKVIEYQSGSNDMDIEDLMSIPVKYKKFETKDATGAAYAMPRLVETSRKDAEYIELDWTSNTLPQSKSPYSAVYEGCLSGVGDVKVADVDMRLDQGILNFSQQYSSQLSWACIGDFQSKDDYNGTSGYQANARFKERISFKVNDGSTDQSFVDQVPFSAQNALGYGVWTVGQIKPDKYGIHGREGSEKAMPMVHDFRNGKKLVYTVVGLPTDNEEMRKVYLESTEELVASWNLAYKQAFKGSALERAGNYVEFVVDGENGVKAHLGDLDKNIIYFENKIADHGVLGVSQVGFNPRSAIVVADSLIMYAGNIASMVANDVKRMQIKADWEKAKEEMRKNALAQLAEQDAKEAAAKEEVEKAKAANNGSNAKASTESKAIAANALTREMVKLAKGQKLDTSVFLKAKNLGLSKADLKKAVAVQKSLGGDSKFKFASPQAEYGWMDKVFRAMNQKPNMSSTDIEALIAKEVLASKGSKLSAADRQDLQAAVKQAEIRSKLIASMNSAPGCMKTAADTANSKFVNMSLREAIKLELMNTMVHEMGHSQGLTHNFVGSYDKANFANEDGTPSNRNYSSVMDYLTPGRFTWDGLGTYDIRALRASHLGLVELSTQGLAAVQKAAPKSVVNDKFVHVSFIKENFAKSGWANFTKHSTRGFLKDYKYCTDIDVGYEPTCQRHDFGTSAEEIVDSLITDWEEGYTNSFHSWDRLKFGVREGYRASGMSTYYMWRMRVFVDELFYNLVLGNNDQEEVNDLVNASVKVYLFYNQLINTPDANKLFMDGERFLAVPYNKKEIGADGKPTGKTLKDVAVVETRAIQDLSISDKRLDTVGLEYEKIAAMELLTMKGYPSYKYAYQGIQFSFMDLEKYVLGMEANQSLFMNTLAGMMLDQLQPTFTNEDVQLQPIPGLKATVTSAMRFYAGIYGILNLEASTLRDKDNFATLLKVGSSVGNAPADRIAVSPLGVNPESKTRLSYWALDNAIYSGAIINLAAEKDFFIQNEKNVSQEMMSLAAMQLVDALTQGKQAAEVEKAKAALVAKLTALNSTGKILSEQAIKQNPELSINAIVEDLMGYNENLIQISIGLLTQNKQVTAVAGQFAQQSGELAEELPLHALNQKAAVEGLKAMGTNLSKQKGFEILANLGQAAGQLASGTQLETSYGIILKNLEFLNKLTIMTNPEHNR